MYTIYTFMREWLRGRASPCQGEGRGFESRFALADVAGSRWGTFFSSWLVHEIFETFDLPANFSAFDSTSAPHFLEFFPTSF